MKIALCSLMDDNFVIGFKVFIKSLLKHNPWFDYDYVILDNDISDESKEEMNKCYDKLIFRKIKKERYEQVDMSRTADKLKATYYTLDVFSIAEYDRIVFMDVDMLVLDDLSEVFNCGYPFAACKAYNSGQDITRNDINSGLFVINEKYLNKVVYNDLLRIARRGFSMPDQKVLNRYFINQIHFLDKRYNVEKRMYHTKQFKKIKDNPAVIHYVATKPWEPNKPNEIEASFSEWENLWMEYYNG